MWDYLFYFLYLEAKDPTDFTGLETYCWQLIQEKKITWFPIKKAIIIEGRNKEKKDVPGLYLRLGGMEARAEQTAAEVRALREMHEEQQAGIKEVREEMVALHKVAEEIRGLAATAAGVDASGAGARPVSAGRQGRGPGYEGRGSEVSASLSSHA